MLTKVALSVQLNMKIDLREISGAPTRAAAEAAIDLFADKYNAKHDKAVVCLSKEALLAFFLLPRRALGPSAHIKSDQLKTHLKYAVSPISLEGLFARLFARGGYWRAHVSCCLT